MPKANPFAQVAKRLASLQAKSAKINEELKALAVIVDVEAKKIDAAPVPVKAASAKAPVKVALAKKAPAAKTNTAPRKKGRPFKK